MCVYIYSTTDPEDNVGYDTEMSYGDESSGLNDGSTDENIGETTENDDTHPHGDVSNTMCMMQNSAKVLL